VRAARHFIGWFGDVWQQMMRLGPEAWLAAILATCLAVILAIWVAT